jgi:hypothetical protein
VSGELTCEQDKAPTRLTCTQCASPICPQCFVRTPVGLKCPACGQDGRREAAPPRGRPWVVPLVVGVVLAAVIGLPRLFSDGPASESQAEPPVPDAAASAAEGPARLAVMGEEALDGGAAFTATSFECGGTEIGSGAGLRRAQGHYCLLAVTVRNVGRAPVRLVGPTQTLIDGQSRRYAIDERATAAHPANLGRDPVSTIINPSNELQAVFVFDVPPDVDPVYANLRASPQGPGATILLKV